LCVSVGQGDEQQVVEEACSRPPLSEVERGGGGKSSAGDANVGLCGTLWAQKQRRPAQARQVGQQPRHDRRKYQPKFWSSSQAQNFSFREIECGRHTPASLSPRISFSFCLSKAIANYAFCDFAFNSAKAYAFSWWERVWLVSQEGHKAHALELGR